jgi:tRNA A-37 threonylcarbamoyl transferase component Bud32
MINLSDNQLQALSENAIVLESDGLGAKVLKLKDDSFLKLFRKRSLFSSETLKPYAIRFAENAEKLRARAFISPKIIQVYSLTGPVNATAVHYQPLPGNTLRSELSNSSDERNKQLIKQFGALLAKMHESGVYFRSAHLGNILVQPDGNFGLIDLADMKISNSKLTLNKRLRNLKHISRYKEDNHWLFELFREELKAGYSQYAKEQTEKLFPNQN